MLPPYNWPDEKIAEKFLNFLWLLELYVDNFYKMVQTTNKKYLKHVSWELLTAIHEVFLPQSMAGHIGEDPV